MTAREPLRAHAMPRPRAGGGLDGRGGPGPDRPGPGRPFPSARMAAA
ncbi:hypothetical protein SAMN04489712_10735 [Thermomonospora echinospora]|uniref:Uncharacterized protein n=1 Tax=Thermomonospora echinospora TaxID=1992 RepID=A0A1H6BE64_9ACTN|nr:hypothetical protein [Thermomonospora echinospora]SEG58950.1 hypothetical protein SAMN04489712_10735 [Thermomonospora echinospora]